MPSITGCDSEEHYDYLCQQEAEEYDQEQELERLFQLFANSG